MTPREWEDLCDGCGWCCVFKLDLDEEDAKDVGRAPGVHQTNTCCRLLDTATCRCSNYVERHKHVPDCIVLNAENVGEAVDWLPESCAYRRVKDGKGLEDWHWLVSGSRETVHEAGKSASNRVISDEGIDDDDLADYIVDWKI
eukprot:CAMPEP_0174902248 /NCGR_PEP_ID=MMETSP0167-20121228/37342_1 /TAXON_ID=38298 /ORGANISM="Rhodella maculata, Strain CCMP736" /LENGTH=142 /DNA_ID=CAMNT_0016144197 /DNA_START=182 /DNA_END=610 /DNA_ORIENTATION=+